MHQPDLIILDEPTSGLDPLVKQVFYDMVLEMRDSGKTVFVSSHDLAEVQKICDRAGFIREGKLIAIEDIKATKNISLQKFTVAFETIPDIKNFKNVEGVGEAYIQDDLLHVTVKGSIAPFISALAKYNPIKLSEKETSVEDLFMHFYEKGDKNV